MLVRAATLSHHLVALADKCVIFLWTRCTPGPAGGACETCCSTGWRVSGVAVAVAVSLAVLKGNSETTYFSVPRTFIVVFVGLLTVKAIFPITS